MVSSEVSSILLAIIVLTIISGFSFAIQENYEKVAIVFFFSTIVISVSILAKKIVASLLDADIEHEILKFSRYGFRPHHYLKDPIPIGVILPLVIAIFSLGIIKFSAMLSYEAKALKYRAAKRFGYYSFTEMTDWHHALIGATGIVCVLLISFISYFIPLENIELLSKMATYYAFWNLIPILKFDGAQIFFGSRILWSVLFSIACIFTAFALIIY